MSIELIVDGTRIEFRKELSLKSLPEKLERGKFYKFEVEGYCVFPLGKSIFLKEETNSRNTSPPLASIEVVEQHIYLLGGIIHTKGEYLVRNISSKK